jgi:hypothetical protein
MTLRAVSSRDLDVGERVEVLAEVLFTGSAVGPLEKIVADLGLDPGVNAVSWTAVATDPEDRSLISEA